MIGLVRDSIVLELGVIMVEMKSLVYGFYINRVELKRMLK